MAGAVVAWTSSDVSVAMVDQSGLVRGVSEGSATITATAGNARGTAEITVADSERAALVALYNATDGPNWVNNENWLTDAPLGEWYGVDTDASGRVVQLDLGGRFDHEAKHLVSHGLTGPIPAELGSLTSLQFLRLSANALEGRIPPELGNLTDLEYLDLYSNALEGRIPSELGNLTNMGRMLLGSNNLTGSIPVELGRLTNLQQLGLSFNQLEGRIPPELGNLTNLRILYVGDNNLTGSIPAELGSLTGLEQLGLSFNELEGRIPPELGNLTNLRILYLRENNLTGPVPRSLLDLAGLEELNFGANAGLCAPGTAGFAQWLERVEDANGPFCNQADREILELLLETTGGSGWTNREGWLATQALEEWHGVTADSLGLVTGLDLTRNGLSGRLPATLGDLARMTVLRIGGNALSGRLPSSLTQLSIREFHYADTGLCAPPEPDFRTWLNNIPSHEGTGIECEPLTDREILEVFFDATNGPDWTERGNWLTEAPLGEWHGVQADDRGRVVELDLYRNRLNGEIPVELGRLTELRRLALGWNRLNGAIPRELGDLVDLETLTLGPSLLEGAIPPELGNLVRLRYLDLGDAGLTGSIPPDLGNLVDLRGLYLQDNDLEGPIPSELGNLARLAVLSLGGNRLTGSIPSTLDNLVGLRRLSLAGNRLTGPLSAGLGGLTSLASLYVGHNELTGPVPPEFGGLTDLRELAFSGNAGMSGVLPASLTNLRSLEIFEASGTRLCAPSDRDFLAWLDRIPGSRVALCEREPASAYLVQAVQSRQFPVPLVAGEEALLRVFVTAAQDNQERLPPVRASFYVDGALAHLADIQDKPGPIPTAVDEGSLATSANRVIPADVVRPGLEMVVEIDPEGSLDPGLGVTRRIPEEGRLPVDVREMPLFDLTVIPFLWSAAPDSTIVDEVAGMAADPKEHELLAFTRILLPVGDLDVTAHDPVVSSSNDAFDLLDQTGALRVLEGGRGYYMGTMSWPVTGAVGVARRGQPVSFASLVNSTIAHELGHNMSLGHAPCAGTPGPDPAFPYADGATGAWGHDFRSRGLVGPETKDLMAYCGPQWISDYYFARALEYRLENEGTASAAAVARAERSLLLWGRVDSAGAPRLEPAFVVDAPPTLPESAGEYRLAGYGADGAELFSLSFAMPEVADGDGSSSFAFALPARPGWERDLASIALTGPGGSVTLDGASDRPMAILRDPRTRQVRGFLRDLPPTTLTWAEAAAAVSPEPGLEVLFSRGIPDAEAWRR